MNKEDRKILFECLSRELEHEILINCDNICKEKLTSIHINGDDIIINGGWKIEVVRPQLRPVIAMTEEEQLRYRDTLESVGVGDNILGIPTYKSFDYLDSIGIDYRGLLKRNLADFVITDN